MLWRLLTMMGVILLVACAPNKSKPKKSKAHPKAPIYSPFVVEISSSVPHELSFSVISFKDVGMSIDPSEQSYEYEALAEGVADRFAASFPEPERQASVRHLPEITDKDQHVACEAGHIYVDLWKAAKGTGYSLWSGCGEDDEFAHRELATMDSIAVAKDIAHELRRATDKGCFTRHC